MVVGPPEYIFHLETKEKVKLTGEDMSGKKNCNYICVQLHI